LPKHVAGLPPPSPFTVTILEWLLTDPLPLSYQSYATHVVVADEHYFSTMLSHSPFCRDLVAVPSLSPPLHISPQINLDVNFLQFAQWELGNPAKCLQPDPKRCGRSPANLSPLFFPAVMVSLISSPSHRSITCLCRCPMLSSLGNSILLTKRGRISSLPPPCLTPPW
jgi:hypothetical protein